MAEYLQKLLQEYEESKEYADPRTKNWFLVENNPVYVWMLTIAYLLFIWLGPKFMEKRQAFQLTTFMVVYNLGLVVFSTYMFVEIILSVRAAGYGIICAPYDRNKLYDPKEIRVTNVMYWYFFSKAIELMDTVLMVLRKKNNQITFLHWFHHASMLNIWWWVMMFIPGGLSYFGSCLNCLVHIVMYSYYGLSVIPSLRGKLWWKHYITRFQLIQFCITLAHTLNTIRVGCDFPQWGKYLLAGYMLLMLLLFTNFYIHAYIVRQRRHKPPTKQRQGINHVKDAALINGSAVYTNGYVHQYDIKKSL